MKKSTVNAVNELVELIGGHKWVRTSRACWGDWRGTTDYFILIDGKYSVFVSNGMANFEPNILEWTEYIKRFRMQKDEYLQKFREQAQRDNEIAVREGLNTVRVIDMDLVYPPDANGNYFLWTYLTLEVNGVQYKHTTSNIWGAIEHDCLDQWLEKRNLYVSTAAGIKKPDFIFCGCRYDSLYDHYRIK